MGYEDFYWETWSNIEYQELTDVFRAVNEDQLREITYELWRLNKMSGLITPTIASRIIVLFSNKKLK